MTKPTAQTTKERILGAALESLKEEGFAGATSRAIAAHGGFNQALVFYHYGSLDELLLAALERTSRERLAHYRATVEPLTSLDELLAVARKLHDEDRRSGHMTVVSQVTAGAVNRPELAGRVVELMEPWVELARETVERVLPPVVPAREAADAIVTFYLGVNLRSHLAPDDDRLPALFESAEQTAPLLASL